MLVKALIIIGVLVTLLFTWSLSRIAAICDDEMDCR